MSGKKICFVFFSSILLLFSYFVAADAPENGKLIELSGVTLYYEIRGSGTATPLFIVNGGPGFDHTYLHISDVWDAFAKDRPVIFYDQRGNGRSPALTDKQTCTLADQISDLDALRSKLGFDKIDLLGHSWGGYLVMAYAALHPDHISHLMICDSAAPKWKDTVFLFKDIFPELVNRQDSVMFAEQMGDANALSEDLNVYMSMLFYTKEHKDQFLAKASTFKYSKEINEKLNADMDRFDLNPELPKFRFPTLVMTGRFDINVAPSVAYHIHKAIPDSQFVVFEKSGHLPFFEEKEDFLRVVQDFLKSPAAK
ncbi:MAG: alpha/beta hydrolase [Acidobacteria bacterium]|nr:MAG: alpha/beta hydrolase [Acidobacteriota bacterium]